MIRLITGVPGAGKSYYMVQYLAQNYCSWDPSTDRFKVKDGITIISNIENLKLPHIELDKAIAETKLDPQSFFSKSYQDKIKKKYKKVVYVIDEAQRYFRGKIKNAETNYYFEFHRHFGHDIFLLTQSRDLISRSLYVLCETETRAVPRTINIIGFQYNIMVNSQIISKKQLRKKQKIFALYKSMDQKEVETTRNPLLKWAAVAMVLVLFCGYKAYARWAPTTKPRASSSPAPTEQPKQYPKPKRINKPKIEKPKPDRIPLTSHISHAIVGHKIFIIDPCTDRLIDARQSPFPIQIIKDKSGLTVYGAPPCISGPTLPKSSEISRGRARGSAPSSRYP